MTRLAKTAVGAAALACAAMHAETAVHQNPKRAATSQRSSEEDRQRTGSRPPGVRTLQVRRSSANQEGPDAILTTREKRWFVLRCKGKSISSILHALYETSSNRVIVPESLSEELFDVEYTTRVGKAPPEQALTDEIERVARVRIRWTKQERTVWVAKPPLMPLPKGEGNPTLYLNKDGSMQCQNLSIKQVFRSIEQAHNVLIDDETGLSGRYTLSYAGRPHFAKMRVELIRRYGLELRRTRQKTRLLTVEADKTDGPGASTRPGRTVPGSHEPAPKTRVQPR